MTNYKIGHQFSFNTSIRSSIIYYEKAISFEPKMSDVTQMPLVDVRDFWIHASETCFSRWPSISTMSILYVLSDPDWLSSILKSCSLRQGALFSPVGVLFKTWHVDPESMRLAHFREATNESNTYHCRADMFHGWHRQSLTQRQHKDWKQNCHWPTLGTGCYWLANTSRVVRLGMDSDCCYEFDMLAH